VPFRLPTAILAPHGEGRWQAIVDTARDDGLAPNGVFDPESIYPLEGRSLALLMRVGLKTPAAMPPSAESLPR
jgi:hypothetical protein